MHACAERTGRAMGTTVQVLVCAPIQNAADALAELGMRRITLLERCWSRFRQDSELNYLNAQAGRGPVEVSHDLAVLVERMVEAWSWTQGAFDPTVLRAMEALGYDRNFSDIPTYGPSALPITLVRAAGMADVKVRGHHVTLPAHVGVDPGGIGKGLAADIIAEELMNAGPTGVLINLGGDARALGTYAGEPWEIGIQDDRQDAAPIIAERHLNDNGVATSSTLRRRWQGRHHLIDPATGAPTASDVVQATVIAPTAWQAEAMATVALVRGREAFQAWAGTTPYQAHLFGAEGAPVVINTKETIHA